MDWQTLSPWCKSGKSGKYSTWGVLNALPKWYEGTKDTRTAREHLEASKRANEKRKKNAQKETEKKAA